MPTARAGRGVSWRRVDDATSAPQFFPLGHHLVQFPEHVAIPGVHVEVEDDATKYVLYRSQIEASLLREYINTEGSLWIDRVSVPTGELQRARLGGTALVRNSYTPGHALSWRFRAPANAASTAIAIRRASPRVIQVLAHNLSAVEVQAIATAWDIEPGIWRVSQGIDSDGDDVADRALSVRSLGLERSGSWR